MLSSNNVLEQLLDRCFVRLIKNRRWLLFEHIMLKFFCNAKSTPIAIIVLNHNDLQAKTDAGDIKIYGIHNKDNCVDFALALRNPIERLSCWTVEWDLTLNLEKSFVLRFALEQIRNKWCSSKQP